MLDDTLDFICTEFNQYLRSRVSSITADEMAPANVARLQDPSDPDKGISILATIVNVEEDRISKKPDNRVVTGTQVKYSNPPIHLNLYILFTVNMGYVESLKRLSKIILFFQAKNVFTQVNSPGLPDTIDKLIFDLHTLNFEQINHLWATLGGRHMPSVLYKVRLVTFNDNFRETGAGLIQEIEIKEPKAHIVA